MIYYTELSRKIIFETRDSSVVVIYMNHPDSSYIISNGISKICRTLFFYIMDFQFPNITWIYES